MESIKGGCSRHILSEVIPILDYVGKKEFPVVSMALGMRGNSNDRLLTLG